MNTYSSPLILKPFAPVSRRFACAFAAAGLTTVLALCGAPALATEHVVEIRDNFFSPQQLTIDLSDTVRWTNVGNSPHTTTSTTGLWNSGILNNGQSFSMTFSTEGNFPYFCQVHGQSMSGTIHVGTNQPAVPSTNLFLAIVSGSFKATNALGRVVAIREGARELVADCAGDHQLDPATLVLVYDRAADAINVVQRSNGETVCTMISFGGGANVASADGKRRDRQAFVYWEDSTTPNGSIVGTETTSRGMNGELLKYSFKGSIQFGLENYEDEPPKIFQGTFAVGRRFVPQL